MLAGTSMLALGHSKLCSRVTLVTDHGWKHVHVGHHEHHFFARRLGPALVGHSFKIVLSLEDSTLLLVWVFFSLPVLPLARDPPICEEGNTHVYGGVRHGR